MPKRPPLFTDSPSDLLDHMEFCALTDPDGNASASQLRSDLAITGSLDAMAEDEVDDRIIAENIEGILDAALTEAELRIAACGPNGYPFSLERTTLLRSASSMESVYAFLLLLSRLGKDAVEDTNGAKLFEDVCAHAVAVYLGGVPAQSHVFGFPRRIGPGDFVSALVDLCKKKICEGEADDKFPDANSMKDAGLDIVVWRPLPDKRSSKLIVFGQCATGENWWGKRYELQPLDWCRTWLLKTPHVIPTKAFFVPHSVTDAEWAQLGYAAGIIFDRFRLAHLAEAGLPVVLREQIAAWSRAASVA